MKFLMQTILVVSALLLIVPSMRAASEIATAPQPQVIRSVNPLANSQQQHKQLQQQQQLQRQQTQQLQDAIQVDKRFWFPRKEEEKAKSDEAVNLLLHELSMLEINTEQEKQRQQEQQRQNELANLLLMATNRPRARSNFLMHAPTSGPANFQISPVISGGVSSVPKRVPHGHVPCYFNPISCH